MSTPWKSSHKNSRDGSNPNSTCTMNPMLRWASAIHEVKTNQLGEKMQRKRDAQKVKLREEKEMRRLDAIERDNKRRTEHRPSSAAEREGEEVKAEESAACKFQKELCWCIQQLEMGLATMKPNAKQAVEAEKLLKILRSSKAPMARKRQIMRASFGNYRARMQQEEKKHAEDMERGRSLTPVESDKLNTATFFRRATSSSSSSSSPSHQPVTPKLLHVQPFIPDTVAEETESDDKEKDAEMKDDNEEEEEDVLMKSLESETMGMHLCKSDKSSMDAILQDSKQVDATVGGGAPQSTDDTGAKGTTLADDDEKENIPSRTPTDTDETNHSQISSNFSSTASLFSFNFEIKEEDLDALESSRSKLSAVLNNPKSEMKDSNLMRGLDNRASDSTSSSGGTPTKRSGKKRNRGKRKQQQQEKNQQQQNEQNQNQENEESDSIRSPKEALLTESPKIEMAAKEGFKFDFPEPDKN